MNSDNNTITTELTQDYIFWKMIITIYNNELLHHDILLNNFILQSSILLLTGNNMS